MTLKPYSSSKGQMQLAGQAVTAHKAGGAPFLLQFV